MVPVIVALALVAVVGGWTWYGYKQSMARPMWTAFSATAAGAFSVVAGLTGHIMSRHERFVMHTSSVGHVIWSQVGIGVLFGLVALYFWRRALSGPRPGGTHPIRS